MRLTALTRRIRAASTATAVNTSFGSAPCATSVATRRNAPCDFARLCSSSRRLAVSAEALRRWPVIPLPPMHDEIRDRLGIESVLAQEAGGAAACHQLSELVTVTERDENHDRRRATSGQPPRQ